MKPMELGAVVKVGRPTFATKWLARPEVDRRSLFFFFLFLFLFLFFFFLFRSCF